MSTGMLGNNDTLRNFWCGPWLTLVERINGPEGETYVEALNLFLRKENPWPAEKPVAGRRRKTPKSPSFNITVGDGQTAEQLLETAGFDVFWNEPKRFVLGSDFKVAGEPLKEVELEYVRFDFDPTSDQVLARFNEIGLDRPEPEDVLRFAAKYPQEQLVNPVVFLHEPWRDPNGRQRVLGLLQRGSMRELRLHWFDDRWHRSCQFAARRRKPL